MRKSLFHPRFAASLANHLPCTVTIYKLNSDTDNDEILPDHANLPCSYEAGTNAIPPGQLQPESPVVDEILLMDYYPEIASNMLAWLTIGGLVQKFKIVTAKPLTGHAVSTVLTVIPDQER